MKTSITYRRYRSYHRAYAARRPAVLDLSRNLKLTAYAGGEMVFNLKGPYGHFPGRVGLTKEESSNLQLVMLAIRPGTPLTVVELDKLLAPSTEVA